MRNKRRYLKWMIIASTLVYLTACNQKPNQLSLNDENSNNEAASEIEIGDIQKHATKIKKQKEKEQQIINPSARTCPDSYGFTTMVEFTYWNAFDDGFTAAIQATSSPNNPNNTTLRPVTINSDWQPGFRVGIGYNCVYDDWWTDLNYTYFRTRDSVNKSLLNPSSLFLSSLSENTSIITSLSVDDFHLRWKLGVDLLDLELGRNFFVSHYLSMSPFISVRGAWIRRKANVHSQGSQSINTGSGSLSQTFQDHFLIRQTNWGVGPRIGVNTRWFFGNSGFAFFMNGDGALMYSGITVHGNDYDVTTDSVNGTLNNNIFLRKTVHRVMPNLSLFGGLDYQHCWKDRNFALHVYAGYSFTYFWNQQMFFTPLNLNPQGNLGLQGLNTGFKFEW